MKRKLMAMFLSLMILCSFGLTVYADPSVDEPAEPIEPVRYAYIDSFVNSLNITNRKATCISTVRDVDQQVTKIELTQTLELSLGNGWWYTIQTWSKTVYSYKASNTTTRSGLDSGTYRVRSCAKAYCGSNYETIYTYSTPVSC